MKIIAFTGAGISQESGLDTFRKGGLWDGRDVHEVANIQSWWRGDESRQVMLDFYNQRSRDCHAAQPNAAHLALAEAEANGHEVTIVTQNVDNLHERAGSRNVIHLHGELMKARPEEQEDGIIDWPGDLNLGDTDAHGTQLRPHIVWFGEGLPVFDYAYTKATATDVDVLLVIGTSLEVGPANLCAFDTKADSVYLIDPDPPSASLFGSTKAENIRATATEGVKQVLSLLSLV